jgi:hypothetical protein
VRGEARAEQICRLEQVPIGRHDEVLGRHGTRDNKPTGRYIATSAGREETCDEAVEATPARLHVGRLGR